LGTISSKTRKRKEEIIKTALKQRAVVLIRFPFSDLESSKVRPVIVISNDNYNRRSRDFIAIPMTSQIPVLSSTATTTIVRITNTELEEGELRKQSIAKVDRITSLDQNLIKLQIGRIKKQTFSELKEVLLQVL
jgi:mRNA interferase MazF